MRSWRRWSSASKRMAESSARQRSEGNEAARPGGQGVVLASGVEILATKAVVAGLHVTQVFPGMVRGAELPDEFLHRLKTIKYATLKPFVVF